MKEECKQCGECCSNFLPLSENEIKELKKLAKKENKLLFRQDWYMLCPFLNSNKKCDIYENRPFICREYTCYKFKHRILIRNEEILKEKRNLIDLRKELF